MSRTIIDGIPYMVWTYDASGLLDYANASWTSFTGLQVGDPRSTVSRALWDQLLEADADEFASSLAQAMTAGEPFHSIVKLRPRSAGDLRWHEIRVEPNVATDGRILSWTGTAIDIDDRKRAEYALREGLRQFERERARSTKFQRAALPPNLPTVPGLSFDAVYEPGLSDAQIGGDWYDAVRLVDGRVLLTIGDVAGSGLSAAVIMGVVRQIMRGIAQLHAAPALMLDAADRALRLEYPEVFVTAWVGVIDLVAQTLTYASAGHPPPLLLEPDGTVRELDHRTLPIGLRQGHQGHASTIAIVDRSVLWLYTDGLIEASRDILEGIEKLTETARRINLADERHSATKIRNAVIPHGSPDDVAILVVTTDFASSDHYLKRWQFASADGDAARRARHEFTASLPRERFSEVDIANAEVVFGELCGNVARYAPGIVDVVLDSSGAQSVLHVLDRGPGFRHLSRLPADPLAEMGRGLFIIAAMTTEFTVTQRLGGGSEARAVLVGRYPVSLLRDETLPALSDQVAAFS